MSSESPPTLETSESDNLLDYLRHNTGTANKMRKAVRNYYMALIMLDAGLRVGEVVLLTKAGSENHPNNQREVRADITKRARKFIAVKLNGAQM